MKLIAITSAAIAIMFSFSIPASAQTKGNSSNKSYSSTPKQHNVSGYTRSNGTYVAPHYRSTRDGARNNNWTTQGNTNPHTGKEGSIPRSYYEKKK